MSEAEQAPQGDSIQDAVAKLDTLVQPDSSPEEQAANPNEEVEHEEVVEEATDEEVAEQSDDEIAEDSSDEEEQTEEDSEPEFVTEGYLEVDGERVSIDEAKMGYLRQSDYTKKTQLLSEQRKVQEQKAQTYESSLNALLAAAGADLSRFSGVNWEQAAIENPDQYKQAKAAYDQTKSTHDFIQNQVQAFEKQQQADLDSRAKESLTVLKNSIPNWNNDLYYDIGKYANNSLGVTPDEYNQISDHRVIMALHKSMQFDRATTVTKKKVKSQGKKTLSSKKAAPDSVGRSESLRKARTRLRESGNMTDAVEALSNLNL